jgi:hypothetical protein
MGRTKSKKAKVAKATIVGEPVIDTSDKRIVYCLEVGGIVGNAWEYRDTGEAALAVVNFPPEIHSGKRALIWSAVTAWRAANRDKYTDLLRRL